MPKRDRSLLFFPRQKDGEDAEPGPLTRHIRVSHEVLKSLFHLKLKDAAREIGLCPTTFKKACRRFHIEKWPSRTKQRDAAIRMRKQDPEYAPAAPTLQTTEVQQARRAVTVSCTAPVWHDGGFSSAAPQDLPQKAAMAFDTPFMGVPMTGPSPLWHDGSRAWRDTSSAGFPFSSIASSSSNVGASSEPQRDCATPLETGPPRERSCVEAVMDYLDHGCSISVVDVESMLSDDFSLQF